MIKELSADDLLPGDIIILTSSFSVKRSDLCIVCTVPAWRSAGFVEIAVVSPNNDRSRFAYLFSKEKFQVRRSTCL